MSERYLAGDASLPPILNLPSALPFTECIHFARSLLPHLPDLSPAISLSLSHCSSVLSDREDIAAIHFSTQDNAFTSAMREALRASDRTHLRPFGPFLQRLFSALHKLPREAKTLLAVSPATEFTRYSVSKSVIWWGGVLCIAPCEAAEAIRKKEGATLYRIQAVNAVHIGQFSGLEWEYALLNPCELEVVCKETVAAGRYMVHMRERDMQLSLPTAINIPVPSFSEIEALLLQSWPDDISFLCEEDSHEAFSSYTKRDVEVLSIHSLTTSPEVVSRFLTYSAALRDKDCCWLWHGTSSVLCRDATCRQPLCSLCGITYSGFRPDAARTHTASYEMYGKCTYFSTKSINSHCYNGQNEDTLGVGIRALLLSYVAIGSPLSLQELAEEYHNIRSEVSNWEHYQRYYFEALMGRKPQESEKRDMWPRFLSPNFHSFHAIAGSEDFENYMIPRSEQILPLFLVIYRYPSVLKEGMPDRIQGGGKEWCQFHRMRHVGGRHSCDNTWWFISHFAGADFCSKWEDAQPHRH